MHSVDLGANPAVAERPSFSDFYRAELDGQVRRAALMLGSSMVANDVVHDAFLRIHRRWDAIAEPGPYLNRAVLNGCRDAARRRAREMRLLPRLIDRSVGSEAPDSLADALAVLPFNQRAAIVLRFYIGLSISEIADALGCQPGTVGPWITRGLRQLRKDIAP